MKFKTTKKDTTWKDKMERIKKSKLWAADMSRIAVKILDYLEENDKPQRWLAEQLDVTPQQITKIVKGRQNMSWGTIKKIEAVLGIKLVEVAKEIKEEKLPARSKAVSSKSLKKPSRKQQHHQTV